MPASRKRHFEFHVVQLCTLLTENLKFKGDALGLLHCDPVSPRTRLAWSARGSGLGQGCQITRKLRSHLADEVICKVVKKSSPGCC